MQRWSKDSFSSAAAAELSARSAHVPPLPEIPAFDCSLPKEGAGVRELDGPEVFEASKTSNDVHHPDPGIGERPTSAIPQVIVSGTTGPGEKMGRPQINPFSLEVPQPRLQRARRFGAFKPQDSRWVERCPALPSKKQKIGLKPKNRIPEHSQQPPLRRIRSTGDQLLQLSSDARWQERVRHREVAGNAAVGVQQGPARGARSSPLSEDDLRIVRRAFEMRDLEGSDWRQRRSLESLIRPYGDRGDL
ncbi:hypothetical protein LTR37_002015 [Vermiconidia calcicola]|uniref:Uncharacterized protein n=1 Tax=Vermiconidia calcicola TaxID=1690605 RepID=A0ACC3NWA7_9PEZI|nr:hypothetical protein LTR37_002015 [Vermiconidia calcicola]